MLLTKIAEFRQAAKGRLFDILTCKSVNILLCKCNTKVPFREKEFLTDQRSDRKMVITSVDVITTTKIKKNTYHNRNCDF